MAIKDRAVRAADAVRELVDNLESSSKLQKRESDEWTNPARI